MSPSGHKYFAPNDFSRPLNQGVSMLGNDTLFTETSHMVAINDPVQVAGGSFKTLALQRNISVKVPSPDPERKLLEYRARNVKTLIFQIGTVVSNNIMNCAWHGII